MKKIIVSLTLLAGLGLNASAFYFDGGVTGTTGPDGYRGTKLDLVLGTDSLVFEPSVSSYKADAWDASKTFRAYALRVGQESALYTWGIEAGATPKTDCTTKFAYENTFGGADITFSLTPGTGGHSRLAGPGSRNSSGGGEGVSRIDIGASARYTEHKISGSGLTLKTGQAQGSLFAGAKIMMVNLSAGYTAYTYGDHDAPAVIDPVTGQNFTVVTGDLPKSSVNVKLDIPATVPMVTPFVGYTSTKYRSLSGVTPDNNNTYTLGAYMDLKMVSVNVAYQIFDDGSKNHSFVSLGAGLKF
jgi:hypothetical protein